MMTTMMTMMTWKHTVNSEPKKNDCLALFAFVQTNRLFFGGSVLRFVLLISLQWL